MEFLTENHEFLWAVAGAIIALATIIVRWTKTTKDDAVLDRILQVINIFRPGKKTDTQTKP